MTVSIRDRLATGADQSRWLGNSEMAERVRAFDWSATPLGALAAWPRSLRSAVAICLHSRFQMAIYWGPELNCIYNDAERDVLGALHPGALGMPARELLRDSWNVVGPQLQAVIDRGDATWVEDQPLSFDRRGVLETGYFTYSYSPIPRDEGGIGGVLLVTQETTARVLAERRLEVLRELATRTMDAPSPQEACELAAQTMHGRAELDFVLIYLTNEDGERAVCVAESGRSGHPNAAQPSVELDGSGRMAALFRDLAAARQQSKLVDGDLVVACDSRSFPATIRAVAVAISRGSADPVAGFLVAGINNDFASDESCRHFIETIGIGLGRSVAAARARELERARTRSIAALDHAKTALFSNTSHELRTPLSLILGPLQQVLDDVSVPGSAREQVALARRSASRMLKMVNGLLDFSRIEAGEWIGSFQPTDLAQLTRDVVAMFSSTAEGAGLRLFVDCPPLAQAVYVDHEAWERIVSNLLSNALKFTPAGSIRVQIRGEREQAVLTVQDTGIGIAGEDLSRIFSRFQRVDDPRARAYEGTGIGLALVRELVHIHGGSVTAESSPGRGTVMTVRLPLGREHLTGNVLTEEPSAMRVGAAAALFVEEARGWVDGGALQQVGTSGQSLGFEHNGSSIARAAGSDGKVLLVEDNNDMRDYLCRLLSPHYTVDLAPKGVNAFEMAVDNPPSVVISDVMVPGTDGFRLLRDLRSDTRTRDLPVILVSSRADPESTLEALELGADDYLVKPFGARELLARIRATLHSARIRSDDAEARGRAEQRARTGGELRALLNDLRAAQRRIAAAGDAERRRIERNLHDGAQQRLMAIRLELGLLSEGLERDPSAAQQELDRLRSELDEALEELRELAHGLYPPLLASDGLCAAVSAAARRATIPVEVDGSDFPRLPRAIESAAYFCCLEALQNAAKHAGEGARATVRLDVRNGSLQFNVSDDGVGFDRDAVSGGYGLTNLADRLEALGGEAAITSVPGKGTTMAGQIPLP
jgi:signal transduction histidine kinase